MVTLDWDSRAWGVLAAADEYGATDPSDPMLRESGTRADQGSTEGAPPAGVGGHLPEAWFRAHFEALWRLVARLGVPSHHIDDVVQETFITASRRRADIHEGQERRFLFGTAVRLSSNYRQRASVRHEVSHTEAIERKASPLPDAEQLLIEKRMRQQLDQALSALSEEHRTVFVLYELEGFSVPELAQLLELPLGTVASRLGRARAKFSLRVARLQQTAALDDLEAK